MEKIKKSWIKKLKLAVLLLVASVFLGLTSASLAKAACVGGEGNGIPETGEECDDGAYQEGTESNGQICSVAEGNLTCNYCSDECEIIIVTSINCEIALEKTVSPSDCVDPGGQATYTYRVSNPGDVDLSNVTLIDNKLGTINCPHSSLDVGDEMTCTATATINSDTDNIAEVTGETWDNLTLRDQDDASIEVCEVAPYCGDGILQEGEECEIGFPCPSNTQVNTVCEDCQCIHTPICGNGSLDPGEECDDGNNTNGDGCESDCTKPDNCNDICISSIGCDGGWICSGDHCRNNACTAETDCICATCGDGDLDSGEECDDGNNTSGDGCESDCTKPDGCNDICTDSIGCDGGWICSGDHCRNDSCTAETDCICADCGDGDLDPGEECDDGNNTSGDGCSSSCKNEDEDEDEDEDDCDASIGNYIWYDGNGDGIQDDSEEGIDDVKVCAYRGNKKYCDTTNSEGRYKIKDLCEGGYDVRVSGEDVAGLTQTYDPDGKLDNETEVELEDCDEHTKADFGYRGVAPQTGVGTNIAVILLISLAITAATMAALVKFKKI